MSEKEIVRLQKWRLGVIRHALEVSHNVAKTCRYYGIGRTAYYEWYKKYQEEGEEGNAIQFYFEGGSSVKNNTVSNNTMDNVRFGVLFDSRTRLMTNDFSGNLVEDNNIRNVWNGGIIFQGGSGTSGSPITIRNNTVTASTGAQLDNEQNEKGLIAVYANYSSITGNTISGGADNGIWVDGSHHTVTGNSINSNSKNGIRVGHYKETEPI